MLERRRKGAPTALAVVVCLAASPSTARAQQTTTPTEGVVVQVEDSDLVVDLGAARGLSDQDVVEIWRPLRVRHPVTGRTIVDRFPIGRLRLVQVRPNLSLAKPDGSLARAPQVGDVLLWETASSSKATEKRTAPPPALAPPRRSIASTAPAASPESARASAADEEGAALSQLFESLRGATVEKRIQAYDDYASAHSSGRYSAALSEEATSLRGLLHPEPAAVTVTVMQEPEPITAQFQAIDRAVAGEPLRLAIATGGSVTGAVLHARTSGKATFSSVPMTKVGDQYWAGTVPGDAVQSPRLEWFVEAIGSDGAHPVAGDPTAPQATQVQDVRPSAARKVLGEAQIWSDYASFNVRRSDDYVSQTEGVMGARFDDVGIRAVRTGFGVYRGAGGTLQRLDVQGLPGTPVGLTYGYLEGEVGVAPTFSLAGRAIVGLREDGLGGGASAFLRIGSDLATNLMLGGEVLGGIGLRGIAEFDWRSFYKWPVMLRSEVTNQPAGVGSDVGVRLIAQVGYRVLPHLVVALRASYQGRTINHAGPGAGAALEYAW